MKMYATDIRYSNESSCVLSGVGCTSAEEGNVEWPALHSCHATMYPCVKYHPFFKGGSVVRECSSQDELLRVDFSNCSVLQSDFSTPFAVVWFTFAGTIGLCPSALCLLSEEMYVNRIHLQTAVYM